MVIVSLSQIKRESKLCADSMVKMTDSAKARLAGPGTMDATTFLRLGSMQEGQRADWSE